MKWLTLFFVTFSALVSASVPMAAENEAAETVEIKSISYTTDEQESVVFQLSSAITPKVFGIKGENPRLVIDLPGAMYAGPTVVVPEGAELASKLRI